MKMIDKIRAKQPKPPEQPAKEKPKKNPPEQQAAPAKKKTKFRPRGHVQNDAAMEERGRLPDGAIFAFRYSGTDEKWYGTLHVSPMVFEAEASALFTLANKLDKAYRQWAKEQNQTPNQKGSGTKDTTTPSPTSTPSANTP